MISKTQRRIKFVTTKHRSDTVWKKIMRDVREFFRILFRVQFWGIEISNAKTALKLMNTMFQDLGITLTNEESTDPELFDYLTQYHCLKKLRMFIRMKKNESYDSVFRVIARYNEANMFKFMKNRLGSQLFYFVYSNFMEYYVPHISIHYKTQVITRLWCILNWFRKMKSYDHLDRIEVWLKDI